MKPRLQRWLFAMVAVCLGAACAERSFTAPETTSESSASLSSATGTVVGMLKRTDALTEDLRQSRLIGPRGGQIQIRKAGLRIEFAPGAVSVPTRITVTALRGNNVAYRFEPHGIQFSAPVTIRQSLRETVAWKNPAFAAELQGSYFERLLVDRTETYARSLERRPARLREANRLLEFSIEHFSGYMISYGKAGVEVEVDIEIAR